MNNLSYADIPQDWPVCMQADCPLRMGCLRSEAASLIPSGVYSHATVLPSARTADGCRLFVSSEPQRLAFGMSHITDGMNPWLSRDIHADLFELFGSRATFYRYMGGSKPLTPAVQERVAAILHRHGVSEPPRFDRMELRHYFPEG